MSKSNRNIHSNYKTEDGRQMNLGFITWNIGKNINKEKITKLVDEYKEATNDLPDILFIALQEIPVNKIGFTRASFKDNFYAEIGTLMSNALDEYQIIDTYQPKNTNSQKQLDLFTCTSFVSSAAGGFGIATFILKKKEFNRLTITPISYHQRCFSTKGYCAVKIQFGTEEGAEELDVINTHMPFDDMKKTLKFVIEMRRWLEWNGYKAPNQVILGDLNSRSLLTEDCYAKHVTTCSDNETKTKNKTKNKTKTKAKTIDEQYCLIKNRLEMLTFKDSIIVENKKESQNNIEPFHYDYKNQIKIRNLSIPYEIPKILNCNIESRFTENIDKIPMHDLINILHKSDFLYNYMNSLFPGFDECPIRFLPSYKRNTTNGKFSLIKKEKEKEDGRLPGYADRILLKGFLPDTMDIYQTLPVTGNDHLPVALTIPHYAIHINNNDSLAFDSRLDLPYPQTDNITENIKPKRKKHNQASPPKLKKPTLTRRAKKQKSKSSGGNYHKTRKNRNTRKNMHF